MKPDGEHGAAAALRSSDRTGSDDVLRRDFGPPATTLRAISVATEVNGYFVDDLSSTSV